MATVEYRYELRRGRELVATGRLTWEQPLEVGARLEIAGHTGRIRSIEPVLGQRELHLVVSLDSGPPPNLDP
jgi:hypothetical protein